MKDVYLAETVIEFMVVFQLLRENPDSEHYALMLQAMWEMHDIAKGIIQDQRDACYRAYYGENTNGTIGG